MFLEFGINQHNIYYVIGVVYGVSNKDGTWPFIEEKEASEEFFYIVFKTAQGLLEFKCKSKLQRQKWIDGVESLLCRVNYVEATEHSLEFLSMNTNI